MGDSRKDRRKETDGRQQETTAGEPDWKRKKERDR
jgi:hypothetical protein